jgi:hypothetical protein
MRILLRRVWCVLRRRRLEVELAEELDFHLAMIRHRLEADGVAPTDAAITARKALGVTLPCARASAICGCGAGWTTQFRIFDD